MLNQLKIDFTITKEKYMALIFGVLSFIFSFVDRGITNKAIVKPNEIQMTMSFANSSAVLTVFCIITLFLLKQYNLKKYKLEEWYYTKPKSVKGLIISDIIFVLLIHIIAFAYWTIFNAVNQTTSQVSNLMMVFAVSLLMHAIYLALSYGRIEMLDLIMTIIYTAVVLFAWMFHSMLVRNDKDFNLNLSHIEGWNFYLYQLPYIILVIGMVLLVVIYPITYKRVMKSHVLG